MVGLSQKLVGRNVQVVRGRAILKYPEVVGRLDLRFDRGVGGTSETAGVRQLDVVLLGISGRSVGQ